MPILHGVSASPFVRKVRVGLAEKGIEYESNPVMPFGQTEEYKKKSPLGKIPCWEDGDFVLPDSSCILSYLEATKPTPALYPSDPKERVRALWYEEYGDSKLVEACGTVFFQRFVRPNFFKQDPDEALVTKALEETIPPIFDYLEGEIGERDVMVGAHFSVADIGLTSPLVNFAYAGEKVDPARWPNLAAYVDRMHARPAYKAVLEDEGAPSA